MIYSITLFFNELDLLDLKIKEESPYIDKMIIVESSQTFAGNPKPFNFPVDKYKDNKTIEYVTISPELFPNNNSIWIRENFQRNYAITRLDLKDNDVILTADIDEIINGENIERIVDETKNRGIVRLDMRLFYYYINVFAHKWNHPYAMTGEICRTYGQNMISHIRSETNQAEWNFENSGNHFSYLGGAKKIEEKLNSFAHTEYNTPEIKAGIQQRLENLEDVVGRPWMPALKIVDIDELHPKTIRENLPEWAKYIRNKEM